MNMKLIVILFFSILASVVVKAASATGKCKQVVIENLSIQKISDLDFGTSVQGEAPKIVSAGTQEDSSNASFVIQGTKNKSVSIILPPDNAVFLILTSPSSTTSLNKSPVPTGIPVNQFTANLLTGVIGNNGLLDLYVGATRSAIATNQIVGYYEGSFTVEVIY